MNVLFISIDSLNRQYLPTYEQSPDIDVNTPNIDRFGARSTVFDNHYAGSLPCMPARREWLAGIQEFLWRGWGPIEAYDVTLPERVRREGVVTQLITDHYHYFQHGSHGYYEDFNGFEFIRGHEYDAWKTSPKEPDDRLLSQITKPSADDPHSVEYMNRTQYARNVDGFSKETDYFAPKVFSATQEWLCANQDWDRWFCYVDSFDIHEPFHCPEPYASMYTSEDPTDPELVNWPFYGRVDEGQSKLKAREIEFVKSQYAGKLTMVDKWFGRVLDTLDEQELWDDTMVILTSDHGHFLGDHGWIGKPDAPLYNTLARIPLLIWHPNSPRTRDRLTQLTTSVDLYSTILEALNSPIPDHVHSRSLLPLLAGNRQTHRDWVLYGYWGSSVNITNGRWSYHRPCDEAVDAKCYSTHMMTADSALTPPKAYLSAQSGQFLPYTESPVWRYSAPAHSRHDEPLLFDVRSDPQQEQNLARENTAQEQYMRQLLTDALVDIEAPKYQFDRLGLTHPSES
jgi:arylsulfatase A-like enzyme